MSDAETPAHDHEGPGYTTPQAAIEESEPEEVAYVMGLYVGTDVDASEMRSKHCSRPSPNRPT